MVHPARATAGPSWRSVITSVAFGYLLAVMTFLMISGTKSTTAEASSPSRGLLLVEQDSTRPPVVESESAHQEEAEEEEEDLDETTLDTTIALIVLLLILLTIAFEHAKEHVEETADRNMKPIIRSLFGEMTVLGFLSIFTFCVTKLGVFEQLSIQLFGEQEEEALLETFEFVHYLLFFIMVFFVCLVLLLVAEAKIIKERWWTMDRAARDDEYMDKLRQHANQNHASDTSSSWLYYCCKSLIPCILQSKKQRLMEDLLLFEGVRKEFLLERSVEPPFEPATDEHRVADDFNFGRYLSICLGHTLGHVVEVKIVTWAFFGLVTIFFYGFLIFVGNSAHVFAWTWAATGWLLFICGNYFDYKILQIAKAFAAPPADGANDANGGERDTLLDSSLPAWCRVDLENYMESRSFIPKWLSPHTTPTRQDTLFWSERKGPKMILLLFQIKLVFTAAYCALLILSFYPYMYHYESTVEFVAYLLVSLLPILIMGAESDESAANMSLISCIGVHRRPHSVAQVIREEKTDRIIRSLVILEKLQHAAEHGFQKPHPHDPHGSSSSSSHTIDKAEIADVSKTFDAFDLARDGYIEDSELKEIMEKVGAPVTKESLEAMLNLLDKDKNGRVSKEEFLSFYKDHILSTHDGEEHHGHHGFHDTAKYMFALFDTDKSGEITIGEFKSLLDAFNVGFTVDEIGELVNELDEQNNGTIGEEEFVELLEKHEHLFKKMETPQLF